VPAPDNEVGRDAEDAHRDPSLHSPRVALDIAFRTAATTSGTPIGRLT
jgi:hypothetical protein